MLTPKTNQMIAYHARIKAWLSARKATTWPGSSEPYPLGSSKVSNDTRAKRFVAAPISAAMPPILCVVFILLLDSLGLTCLDRSPLDCIAHDDVSIAEERAVLCALRTRTGSPAVREGSQGSHPRAHAGHPRCPTTERADWYRPRVISYA